jgi:hypothetical protein
MLIQDIMNNPVLSNYFCNDCEENGVGVSVHPAIERVHYVIIKIDDYFNKEILPNPAGNDCLIVQYCQDDRYKLYLIELKNIQDLHRQSPTHIRAKFQNCFDVFMSDKFRHHFYDTRYEFSAIQLVFVSTTSEQQNRISPDKKQKNTRLDSLLAQRPCRFANKLYGISFEEPYPTIMPC